MAISGTVFARQAVHDMKEKMYETISTPAAARCAVARNLPDQVGIALNLTLYKYTCNKMLY